MNCQHLIEHLDDYADENLGGWTRWRLRLHLWICRNCRRYLASYRATMRLAKRAMGGATMTAPDDLVQSILEARRKK